MRVRVPSLALVLALGALAWLAPPAARAALRSPQVAISGNGLQAWMNGTGESIDVHTDQDTRQFLGSTVPSSSTFTVQFELAKGGPVTGSIGLYDAAAVTPVGFELFPPGSGAGWFAVATFRVLPTRVVVNVFDETASVRGTTSYPGGNRNAIGLYLDQPGVRLYSQDDRNAAGDPQMLWFAGTGIYTNLWWVAAEDAPLSGGADGDFDDFVLIVEPFGCPCPVQKCSWGAVKSRFR